MTVMSTPMQSNESLERERIYQKSFLASVERNQIPISRTILLSLYFLHYTSPVFHSYTSKFLYLQNQTDIIFDAKTGKAHPLYDISIDDAYYVGFYVIALTFLRSILMQWCFSPIASRFCQIYSNKAKVRFAEQSWSFVYYSFSFIYGVLLYVHSPYFLNLDNVYLGWPNFPMTASFKRYYLISIGFWLQQIFVLNIEQKRKDHYQMFSHHIITCLLIIGSYYYYYFRIGHLILMIMDSVDICLSGAKMLRYAGFSTACDVMFLFFLIAWIVLRHGVYNYIFYHAYSKAEFLMADGECIPGAIQKRCWTPAVINFFLSLLGGLQIITIIWMYLIMKVAIKVIAGLGAEDVRSDEDDTELEDDDEEEDEPETVRVTPEEAKELLSSMEKDSSSDATIDDKESSDASIDQDY
ncbi:hypothetical protein G9P44_000133 [Scheffersomyces stipitis]|nr:hypothetical protein G9P44_000133 [Scheffersomyces stipitis]